MIGTSKRSARTALRTATSAIALGAVLGTFAAPALAQDKKGDEATEVETVVVTGTFLRGTPETATIPVEGYNLEEMRDKGSPSPLDFIKNLSEIGTSFGEANRANAGAIGAITINLRSVGAARTVVIFNGRRMNEEYSFSLGRSNNVATIPSCAIGRIEILKDGGGTTYGADAVGGVVNYITRKNFKGIEVNANYRYIKGSDGDYDACVTMGQAFEKFNVQGSFSYSHRSPLKVTERDWAFRSYLENTSAWTAGTNPGSYAFAINTSTTATPTYSVITPTGAGTLAYTGNRQMGTGGIFRDPNCQLLGGAATWSTTPSANCSFPNGYFQELVNEQDIYQSYLEANYEFSPKFKVHTEFNYHHLDIPHVPDDSFTASFSVAPMNRFTSGAAAGQPAVGATGLAGPQFIANNLSYVVPGTNPAVAPLLASFTNANGTSALTSAQLTALQGANGFIALPVATWRPFGAGGIPGRGLIDTQHNYTQTYRFNLEFSGDLGHIAIGDFDWDLSVIHGWGDYVISTPDILVDRLQAALNGYGGPNCTGPRYNASGVAQTAPGTINSTTQCYYFNPFSTAYASNVYTGEANPTFIGTGTYTGYEAGKGLQNNQDMVNWLYTPITTHFPGEFDVIDALLRADLDYHLWSKDPIQVAVGAQYRERHTQIDVPDIGDFTLNPCPTPGSNVCSTLQPPIAFSRVTNSTGVNRDYNRRYPVEAAFAEVKLPITDKLNMQLSTRWEKYFSDVGAPDREIMVSGGGIRWQATPNFALRATAQQSFSQSPPLAPAAPVVSVATTIATQFGGGTAAYTTSNYPNFNLKPERGFNYNIGAVFERGDITLTADFYRIKLGSVVRGAFSATDVLEAAKVPGTSGITALLNCSSDLLTLPQATLQGNPFIQTGVPCVQGTTTINSILTSPTTNINFYGAQGVDTRVFNGGSLDTSGFDVTARWRAANIMGGDISVTGDVSYILTYRVGEARLGDLLLANAYEGIGYCNCGSFRSGSQRVYPFRGSLTLNYNRGRHNFNWTTRIVGSLGSDVDTLFAAGSVPSGTTNANIGNSNKVVVSNACLTAPYLIAPPFPTGALTGEFGSVYRNSATTASVGYDPCANVANQVGHKIEAAFANDFTYRLSLPKGTSLTLTVQNVFDRDPPFSRDSINYDAGNTSGPLGRTYRFGIIKRW